MSINYNGLFKQLEMRNMTLSGLCDVLRLSSATRAKFNRGDYVSLQTLESMCKFLNVTINELVEFVTDHNPSVLYNRLLEEMNHKIKGGIYHELQLLLTYNSNHIEGSQLSIDQTRYIFETNTIGVDQNKAVNVDDIIETKNHFQCVDYAIKTAFEPLTESLIKDFHRLLKTGTSDSNLDWFNVGEYKQQPNTVGGSETSRPEDVEKDINSLLVRYEQGKPKNLEEIIQFHVEFEKIHPFQDGNGRVGRLIAFKECLRYGIVPFTIDESLKMFYYRGLKEYANDSAYLVDTCLAGQDKCKQLLDVFEIKY